MTALSSPALLDPTEVAPHLDVPSPRFTTPRRQAALIVQQRRGRPAPAFVDVLLARDLDVAVTAADAGELPDPASLPLAILVGSEPLSAAAAERPASPPPAINTLGTAVVSHALFSCLLLFLV